MATHLTAGSTVLDRYVIESVLGRGGMSVVYEAIDSRLRRSVAVKVVDGVEEPPPGATDERSEAGMLAHLGHPGLVTLFDAVVEDRTAYLVMELVEGPTLREQIGRAPLTGREAAALASDVAAALHYIHDRGVVHRDVKPANILLAPARSSDRPFDAKLTDFGIARLVDSTRLTLPGMVIGTASYLSPEQALGEQVGPASDVYSLGLVLLEALTGVPAFQGSGAEVITARLIRDPAIPRSAGRQWSALLAEMTRRDPERRPIAQEVARRAHRIASEPTSAPAGAQAASRLAEHGWGPSTEMLTRPYTAHATSTAPTSTPAVRPGRSSSHRVGHRLPSRTRATLLGLGAAVFLIVLATITALALAQPSTAGPASSPLPSVAGSLGVHLKELMKGVTP
ncbi:MAG: serine/threonine protein kinase [Actinomycetota bacterium]|nr:serine/threonine protein kinase [Actinomycetota bacterium]